MPSRLLRALTATLITLAVVCSSTWAWGPTAHTLTIEHAIPLLPDDLKPLYESNSRYLVAFIMLPDDWRQTRKSQVAPYHYIALEELSKPPYDDLVAEREVVEKRLGKDKVWEAGVLPWGIVERYRKLVEAFRKQDPADIVVQSALLGHFIGDAHVPLHATKDWDGRTPEEKGLHSRWEDGLVLSTLKPEEINCTSPEKVNNILKSAFGWCTSSLALLDQICLADDHGRQADPGYGFYYFRILSKETGGILRRQITSSAEAIAGAYIAAWEEAGKPKLSDRCAPLMWQYWKDDGSSVAIR